MATYAELKTLQTNGTKKTQVEVAITLMAEEIMSGGDNVAPYSQLPNYATAHANRAQWLRDNNAFLPGDDLISQFWNAMLASNASSSVATIEAASDAIVLTNVKGVVDILAANDS